MPTTQVTPLHAVEVGASIQVPMVVKNTSNTTVYYATNDGVSSTEKDGTITSGQSVTITATTWFIGSEGDSELQVTVGEQTNVLKKIQGHLEIVGDTTDKRHSLSVSYRNTAGGAASGQGAAASFTSTNTGMSCVEITDVANTHGSLKISHTNQSGSATGDEGAAMVSLELHAGAESASAVQGIHIAEGEAAADEGSTGSWVTCMSTQSGVKKKEFRVLKRVEGGKVAGTYLEVRHHGAGTPANSEAALANLYFAERAGKVKLCYKNGAEAEVVL